LTRIILLSLFLVVWLPDLLGQSGLSIDLKKPEKFENKKLGSEKTAEKKWTIPRRFVQNGVTKFNWHFNARNKLQAVLERAKAQHRDDYSQLLSFYNYTLEATARDKNELDSVIYKANAGILVHDLRNSWIDNLYMLMGQAYYFRNELDTAYLTFQYINYAFAPKEEDGYDIPIGSNAVEGGNAFTISTKENNSLAHKVWTTPPSRNESFIWQIRTFLAKKEMAEAAGLIETLKHDPQFPERLHSDLHEVTALYFYQLETYDSAAHYLEKALDNAADREERARWEYLIGQLYERSKQHDQAETFFLRTVKHTLNPVLEVYARLNAIRQHKGDDKVIDQNIADLVKMARKDRYTNYRDIIYYMAAQMELERKNIAGARHFLLLATQATAAGLTNISKSKAFLELAELSFNEKDYREAKRYYDSVNLSDLALADAEAIQVRKNALASIAAQLEIIYRQDSLQRIAAMPEAEREAFVRKIVKQLRREQGLKDEEAPSGSTAPTNFNQQNQPTDLFSNNNAKGEWYFHNNNLKSKGYNEFRNRWGNRPNVDNWRREAAVAAAARLQKNQPNLPGGPGNPNAKPVAAEAAPLTYEALLQQLPLTPEQLTVSNDSLSKARFLLGKELIEGLEDYPYAITTLEEFIEKYPAHQDVPEALFLLHYCYKKTGNARLAEEMAARLKQQHSGSEFEKILSNPNHISADSARKIAMDRHYGEIYTLFIEGRFEEALGQKRIADSLYGKSYWTPQLLYIHAVYLIKMRDDNTARKVLGDIITNFPESPMAAKAKTFIDVLSRRKEIEDYLTKLQIERPAEDSSSPVITYAPPVRRQVTTQQQPQGVTAPQVDTTQQKLPGLVQQNNPVTQQPPVVVPVKKDTPAVAATNPPPIKADSTAAKPVIKGYTIDTAAAHMVVLVLDKVDAVYVSEARNAFNRYNKETFYNKTIPVNNATLTDDIRLVVMDGFENAAAALGYLSKARKDAAREVIPWLPENKYSFIIISHHNLEVLNNTKDLAAYREFMKQVFPGIN
jgi:tetratricopeptide (TPR) repeat protein